jgi:tripartite-type tricarboxylate transporter receptor subunit TctC
MTRRTVLSMLLSAALAANVGVAGAQDWPARPVTLVVPFAAGGPVDTIARIMAARLSELIGQQGWWRAPAGPPA